MYRKTAFVESLGNSPLIRILDYLIEGRELDYSLTDISENAHVSWSTLHRIWGNLEKYKWIKFSRPIGRAKLYRLNTENPAVKHLIELYDTVLLENTEKHFRKRRKIAV